LIHRFVLRHMGDSHKIVPPLSNEAFNERMERLYHEMETKMKQLVCAEPPVNPIQVLSSVSFAGGGFRTITYIPMIYRLVLSGRVDRSTTFHGASLGAFCSIISCLMTCDHDTEEARDTARKILIRLAYYTANVNVSWYGMWGRLYDVTYSAISIIPSKFLDCFQGKCHMSITQLTPFPRNRIISTYDSIDDLAHHCAISMCVPFFTVLAPFVWYKGSAVCDGGITDNIAKPAITRRHLTVFDNEPSWVRVFVPPTLGIISTQRSFEDIFQILEEEFERSIALWTKKFAVHDSVYAQKIDFKA
jgi:predicted acylesterase/phospholipase RssA